MSSEANVIGEVGSEAKLKELALTRISDLGYFCYRDHEPRTCVWIHGKGFEVSFFGHPELDSGSQLKEVYFRIF